MLLLSLRNGGFGKLKMILIIAFISSFKIGQMFLIRNKALLKLWRSQKAQSWKGLHSNLNSDELQT